MMDALIEVMIVFQDFIFGKQKNGDRKVKPVTIIVLMVLLALITMLIISFFPLITGN